MNQSDQDDSPCIALCSTALGDNVCRGCARTFIEVANWCTYDSETRKRIRSELDQRHRWLSLSQSLQGALDTREVDGVVHGVVVLFDSEPLLIRWDQNVWHIRQGDRRWQLNDTEAHAGAFLRTGGIET